MPLETAEAAVVIVGVVPDRWWRATGDDAPGATGTRTRGFHRVFVVIAAWLLWQQAFVVAEDRAVLAVLERPVANDSRQRVPCLRRQEGGQGIAMVDSRRSGTDRGRTICGRRIGRALLLPPCDRHDQHADEAEQFCHAHGRYAGGSHGGRCAQCNRRTGICAAVSDRRRRRVPAAPLPRPDCAAWRR